MRLLGLLSLLVIAGLMAFVAIGPAAEREPIGNGDQTLSVAVVAGKGVDSTKLQDQVDIAVSIWETNCL